MSEKKSLSVVQAIVVILVIALAIWYFYGGGLEKQTTNTMQQIKQQVADDAVKQYEITKRSGSAADAYVHAGIVAAAYLQANDEANYQKWKEIEKQEGIRAGIPQN